jgi:hypothetical protein
MVGSITARTVATVTLVIAAAFGPVAAGAQETSGGATVYHYATSITQVYGSQYPIAGHLDLEIFPSGIVRGYYHNAFQKAFVPVTGGRDGSYIWFNIGPTLVDLGFLSGPNGIAHIVATMDNDNSFRGQIYPEATASSASAVTNVPSANNIGNAEIASPPVQGVVTVPNEQYLFAAKPIDKSAEDYPGM